MSPETQSQDNWNASADPYKLLNEDAVLFEAGRP